MHQKRFTSRLSLFWRSLIALLLMLPTSIWGPLAAQTIVLHDHGDAADHAHRVAREQLHNWDSVHANQHSPHANQQNPASQEDATSLAANSTSETIIDIGTIDALRPSKRAVTVSQAQPVVSIPLACVQVFLSSQSLLPLAHPLELHNASWVSRTRSPIEAILNTNHALLV